MVTPLVGALNRYESLKAEEDRRHVSYLYLLRSSSSAFLQEGLAVKRTSCCHSLHVFSNSVLPHREVCNPICSTDLPLTYPCIMSFPRQDCLVSFLIRVHSNLPCVSFFIAAVVFPHLVHAASLYLSMM